MVNTNPILVNLFSIYYQLFTEKVPEKVYKGLKAEKHEYKKLCDELGIRPVKAFLDQMHSEVLDLRVLNSTCYIHNFILG